MIRITFVDRPAARRPEPKVGDTRNTKKHGLQIRVWLREKDTLGRPCARVVSRGRPVYAWRSPADLDPWDRHMLEWPSIAAEVKKEKDA